MRVGFLGVGHWHAGMHAKGVLEAGAQIVGVWDPDAGAIARFVSASGGETRPDVAAVLHDRPDLIIAPQWSADGKQIAAGVGLFSSFLDFARGDKKPVDAVNGGAQVAMNACNLFGNGKSQLMTCANSETHLFTTTLADDAAPGWVDAGGRVFIDGKRTSGGTKEIK